MSERLTGRAREAWQRLNYRAQQIEKNQRTNGVDEFVIDITPQVNPLERTVALYTSRMHRVVYWFDGGLPARYLPSRSIPAPGVDPLQPALIAAATQVWQTWRGQANTMPIRYDYRCWVLPTGLLDPQIPTSERAIVDALVRMDDDCDGLVTATPAAVDETILAMRSGLYDARSL